MIKMLQKHLPPLTVFYVKARLKRNGVWSEICVSNLDKLSILFIYFITCILLSSILLQSQRSVKKNKLNFSNLFFLSVNYLLDIFYACIFCQSELQLKVPETTFNFSRTHPQRGTRDVFFFLQRYEMGILGSNTCILDRGC